MESDRIGIPSRLLKRDKGLRIPIEHWGEGLLVFNKPQSIASKADPWYLETPDLESCFNLQIADQKPELIEHGLSQVAVLNPLEPEATGLVLASIDTQSKDHWKNLFGSSQFTFHYILITKISKGKQKDGVCNLPLVRHFKNQHMIVSHRLGKKANTCFTCIETGRQAQAWLASTRYPRLHQPRIHAKELGLSLLNDPRYNPEPGLENLEDELHKLDWVHCYAVRGEDQAETKSTVAYAEPPKYWKRNLRKQGLEIDAICEKSRLLVENMALPNE
jgi:23S rRNA-/tRNA-specific pseudouridylate synthase